ncbi:efflux RND transporter periplasmic adaptor subunit [Paraglaciecola sp. 20A4]|uniref:efflux RND transporter periplasmic adaptor subunit n=1 Tax=Paraglaciecola sp. 20A4 TaxID=2687288 RepID=UPI00140737B8|nr:efflux RND transporter periplasmic adaptor subunit [Paraglaciecola sp. 20A4]
MGQYRKPFLIVSCLLVIVFIAGYLYKQSRAPLEIDVLRVSPGDAQLVLAVVGRVRNKDVVDVRVEFAGKVTALLVDEGDKVNRGDTIAEVRSAAQQAALGEADADLRAVKAQLDFAAQDYKRIAALSKKGLVANSLLDQARTNLESAQAKLGSSQEARNQARIRVDDYIIQSPLDGVVLSRPIDQGQVVGLSDTLYQIGSVGPIEIEAEVDEIYASELVLGMQALLAPTGKQQVTKGRITEISPRVNPLNGSRLTRLMLNEFNADFVPGRSIDVNIYVQSFDEVLSVPRSALRKEGDSWFVYTIVDTTIKSNIVTFIDWPGSSVVLETGLHSGALVALDATIAAVALAKNQSVSTKKMED